MKSKQTRKQHKESNGHAKPEREEPAKLGDEMVARVVEVTPELAKKWLEKNHPDNRPIAWGRVAAFAGDMKAGAWKLTHQAVCFGEGGALIDGQHRLLAVAESGVAVRMLVIKNDVGAYNDPIDRGGGRSIAAIMGLAHRDQAALTVLRMLEQGFANVPAMTLHDAEEVLGRHQKDIEHFMRMPNRGKLYGAAAAACIWSIPIDAAKVADFVRKVTTGEMIGRGDPAWALRSWFERNPRSGSWDKAMATFNCLRFHLNDMKITGVYTGIVGYRGITSKRRALKVAHTPGAETVPAGNWRPQKGKLDEGAEPVDDSDVFE